MKKILLLLTLMVIVLLNNTSGQKIAVAFNNHMPLRGFLSPFTKMGFAGNRANDISIKAVRDFVKTFKTVDNNQWLAAEDGGFTSTFVSDGINTIVTYDHKGHLEHIIKIYDEDKLSSRIRDMVKREYYDAKITLVKEVETDTGIITYVHMQDKDTWKIVRIVDGEMQLVQNLNKG